MAVALLLLTFLAFAIIDWLLSRKHQPVIAKEPTAEPQAVLCGQPNIIDGFAVPEQLRYHPGHSWLLRERKNLARIGADEFAAAVSGKVERVNLPRPGQWLRQGQKAWSVTRKGQTVEMISPTEGEVVEINEELVENPSLLRSDPYGKGWLMMLHVPDEESTTRNLVPTALVPAWMRDSVANLYALQPQLAGHAAADGGRPVYDIFAEVPDKDWKAAASALFLTR